MQRNKSENPPLKKGDQGGFQGFLTYWELLSHVARHLRKNRKGMEQAATLPF
jgi:hypothetical protein